MSRERKQTDVYPTGYCAVDHPGVWAIFTPVGGKFRSCLENAEPKGLTHLSACRTHQGVLAVLSLPEKNESYPTLIDGAYIEVVGRFDSNAFWTVCHYTAPDANRGQQNARFGAGTLDEAIMKGECWLAEVTS